MKSQQWFKLFCTLILGAVLFCACGGAPAEGTSVWIDVPLDGLAFPDVQAIKIEGHAASPGGVSRVEVWINSALLTTVNNPPMEGGLAAFHTEWTPSAPGEYTIQAVAFAADGTASEPDSARVTFGGVPPAPAGGCPTPIGGGPTPVSCGSIVSGCPSPVGGGPTPVSCGPVVSGCPSPVGGGPTPVTCVTPVITDTPTSLPPAGAKIQFWADPTEVQAGACTKIRWHVENVQRVVFGGVDQPFDGSYEDCICANQRYTLKVTHLDGSEEKQQVNVNVSGSCATPEPSEPEEISPPPAPEDTTPPPVPSPSAPADGAILSCTATQTLIWSPVSDDSGIAGYLVKLEVEIKAGQWQSAGGQQVSGTQVSFPVNCGGHYRWMVRAQDSAGNFSNWSAPFNFAINLN